MKISDLPSPVTCAKSDWGDIGDWMGFTPEGDGPEAADRFAESLQNKFGDGYVLEYVTQTLQRANPGAENLPYYLEARERHRALRGKLTAIHRLYERYRPLEQSLSKDHAEAMRQVWMKPGDTKQWSVTFPVIESYKIVAQPNAKLLFGPQRYQKVFSFPSSGLRTLNDEDRAKLADLEIVPVPRQNLRMAIEKEATKLSWSPIDPRLSGLLEKDLQFTALEGFDSTYIANVKMRAKGLATEFANRRLAEGTLYCDECGFDGKIVQDITEKQRRGLLDVHHMNPIAEGVRLTTFNDLAILCPTCHRIEHLRLKIAAKKGAVA